MTTYDEMLARAEAVVAEATGEPHFERDGFGDLTEEAPWLLVERNTGGCDPGWYFTVHTDPDAAADYHYGQEYPDDWTIKVLVHLIDGRRIEPAKLTVVWQPMCTVCGHSRTVHDPGACRGFRNGLGCDKPGHPFTEPGALCPGITYTPTLRGADGCVDAEVCELCQAPIIDPAGRGRRHRPGESNMVSS